MSVKVTPVNQHEYLHPRYGVDNCCLCKSEQEVTFLRTRLAEAETRLEGSRQMVTHYQSWKGELEAKLAEAQAELDKWRTKYSCCQSSPTCANNQLRKFCDEMLDGEKWTDHKEHLYTVIESIETERDMAKVRLKEVQEENARLQKRFGEAVGALEKIATYAGWSGDIAKDCLASINSDKVSGQSTEERK